MLYGLIRENSIARLCEERRYGHELLGRCRTDPDLFRSNKFKLDYTNWTESVAFAVNYAFNGCADTFLDTLGHGKRSSFPGLCRPPWSSAEEQADELAFHLALLDKWFDKLQDEFVDEERVRFTFLDFLIKNGGQAPKRTLQTVCQLENATFISLLESFVHDRIIEDAPIIKDAPTAKSVAITAVGEEYHELLSNRDELMPLPPEIKNSVAELRRDHPDPSIVGFIIMRFGNTPAHARIVDSIRSTLSKFGVIALRADDREYHSDLYQNILTYMYGCGFAIAVYERLESDDFNPNVSLEVGGMLTMGKPVCLLKDRTLRTLHTDLAGKMYRQFDPQDPESTIPTSLESWLRDKRIV